MLKDELKKGSFVLGTWCDLPSPSIVNVLTRAGLDFVIVDLEHGPMDYKIAQEMIMAAECEGKEALIRVSHLCESEILRALDIGASGVIIPHIESVGDRKKAVSYTKFPPLGQRGFNPYVRSGSYHKVKADYFSKENNKVILGLILEGKKALKDLSAIIDDPYVDMIYLGTYDLSLSLGLSGDVGHPKLLRELEKAVRKINKAKKSAGCMIHNQDDLKKFKNLGIRFITYKVDTSIIYDSVAEIKREFDR